MPTDDDAGLSRRMPSSRPEEAQTPLMPEESAAISSSQQGGLSTRMAAPAVHVSIDARLARSTRGHGDPTAACRWALWFRKQRNCRRVSCWRGPGPDSMAAPTVNSSSASKPDSPACTPRMTAAYCGRGWARECPCYEGAPPLLKLHQNFRRAISGYGETTPRHAEG